MELTITINCSDDSTANELRFVCTQAARLVSGHIVANGIPRVDEQFDLTAGNYEYDATLSRPE